MYEGYYSDGKSAARRRVRVTLTMRRLMIAGEDGGGLGQWPIEGLRLAEPIYNPRQPVRLTHKERGEALLTFESQEILAPLIASGMKGRRSWKRRLLVPLGIALGALALFAAALVAAFPYAVDRLAGAIPREWESALGAGVMKTMGGRYPGCRAPAGRAALEGLVNRLAAARGLPPGSVRVRVFRSRIPNAFAAPGGHIGVFEGLFRYTESAEEFAGVLAHEMGHAALRHPTKSLLRRAGFWLLFSAVTGDASLIASSAGKLTNTLLNLSHSREAEFEADREATRMLGRAGIRSGGLARFLANMKRRAPRAAKGGYFSTHPAAGDRIAAMRPHTRPGGPAMTPAQWRALRGICSNTGSW